jgi:MoaA/NifB/PqqE/SkfB family radical SAM enzyme
MPRDVAYVDVIDACQMKCPTCVRGLRAMENSARKMSLEQFGQIIAKLKSEGYPLIGLFNWTEPFLNRTLQEYILIVNQMGLLCDLSTTLSLRRIDNLEECLRAGINKMTISISGMDQATYEVNHVGGALEYVFSNLEKAVEIINRFDLPRSPVLRFIKFDYNVHQVGSAEAYADKVGIRFEAIEGAGNPKLDQQFKQDDEFFRQVIQQLPDHAPPEHSGRVCSLTFDIAAIDCVGDIYLCCAMPNQPALRIGKYLELTEDQILLRRYQHPFCRACAMPRRDATASDQERLARAMASRTDLPSVLDRPPSQTMSSSQAACLSEAVATA